jgi:transcriptional regulator with XRE-family HTH domain
VHPINERLREPGGLAERLYNLRRAARLTQEDLAGRLGWPPSKISKIENGHQAPSPEDVRDWAAKCGQPGKADELQDVLADAQAVHRRWKQRLRRGNASVQEDLDQRTREASRIRCAEILLIPGLLQTAGYARSIAAQVASINGNTDIDATVEARMRRQEALYDEGRVFQFVITEAALRTLPCPARVMAGQLDRLLSLDLDNMTLGIIPMGTELDLAPVHGFLMLDDTAIVETYGEDNVAGEEESAAYGHIFGRLMAEAVTGDEARRLITAAAADLRPA